MNMGVIIQTPVMGMENRGHADIGTQIFWDLSQSLSECWKRKQNRSS